MSSPRRFTVWIHKFGAIMGTTPAGQRADEWETVPVIEAVLTDERIEDFARFLAVDDDPRFAYLWKKPTKTMKAARERYRAKARVYLQVAGFQQEGRDDG